MCDKPILHYLNGRGRMESIRWLLASSGVEFEEQFFETKEDFEKLLNNGDLMFQQVPMVEMDGMKLVQTKAIISYIAEKYDMYGKDQKERAYIDMFFEGTYDLMVLLLQMPFMTEPEKEDQRVLIKQKTLKRYFPVYEEVLRKQALKKQDYLVGNKLSLADVHLLETILAVEEVHPDILHDNNFPNLQAFKARMSALPTIKKFLEPGSKRKPVADEKYVNTVKKVFLS
ncbi:glutathione S-transferase-like isoform X1 [Pyxicephalus adspersus]|uniref:glutathione S-transferase-like isoform X1 n=2 Tax=Pyxicephalus adspersus TaxID=30357 RepID=UPI003B5A3C67